MELEIQYYDDNIEFHPFELVRADDPLKVAEYITCPSHNSKCKLVKKYGRWARHFLRKLRRISRRLAKLFDNYESPPIGRQPRGKKKPGVNKRTSRREKYGIKILMYDQHYMEAQMENRTD